MQIFPVTNSTLSPSHIAGFIKDNYITGEPVNARILKTGINDTYLVETSSDKFIFRVYSHNWRTEKEILAEIQLLQLLQEHTIPVSFPLADKQTNYIQAFDAPEGLRYGVLFSFAQGEKMLQMPPAVHYQIGQVMAGMHSITQGLHIDRITYTPEVLLVESLDQLARFLPGDSEEMRYMHGLQKYLLKTLAGVTGAHLRRGAVHLDIWFDNLVIDQNEAVTIFDFDFCGNGWLVLDIAYYVLQLFSTEKEEAEYNLKKEQFFRGYESVGSIDAEEKELLPAAAVSLYFFYLGVQCRRYDNWSNNFLNEIYLKRFINLLIKKWVVNAQLPVEI